MKLSHALDLQRGSVVAFVGGGGKTSAMFRLAGELVEAGWRVLTTTTTRIARDELRLAPHHMPDVQKSYGTLSLPQELETYRHVFIYDDFTADSKVDGVAPEWIEAHLAGADYWDALLVEADGSRRLPMKAPRDHEPVIPLNTHVVVPVVGLDALGLPLVEDSIYGADVIHSRLGVSPDQSVTPRLMAAVIIHPEMGAKNVPYGARLIPLINKVSDATLPEAREAARYMLTDMNVDRVLIGAVQGDEPVLETRRRVGAVILAAGESRRMGEPKMLLQWDADTIIRHVCQQVLMADLFEVVVVTGRWTDAIAAQLADLPVRIVHNPDYEKGEMLASLKVGLHAIWHTSDACVIVLGDQPQIQLETIQSVLAAYRTGRGPIIAPSYDNRRGHPVLFERGLWPEVLALPPDGAPRDVIRAHADQIFHLVVDTPSVLGDIDTPQDYEQARQSR